MSTPIPATGIALRPSHPGLLLAEEMEHRGLNANSLSLRLKVPRNRLTAIMKGARGISADTAIRLDEAFGIPARLWMALQSSYDLALAEQELRHNIHVQIAETRK